MPFEQWLLFIFGCVSLFIYSLIVWTLRKNSSTVSLGGTFFKLVKIQFVADLVLFIEFSISMRFRKYSSMNELFEVDSQLTGVIPRTVSAFHYYVKIVVYFGYNLFAVNRVLTVLNISAHRTENVSIWSPEILRVLTTLQWTIPLMFVLPTHFLPNFTTYFLVTATSIRLANDDVSTKLIAYIDGLCCLVTCVFCMICYFATFVLLRIEWGKKKNVVVLKKTKTRSNVERGLLISAVLSFLVLTFNSIVQTLKIVMTLTGQTSIFTIYDISYPMIDLIYSHYPWVLLMTSSVLRKQVVYDVKVCIRKLLTLDDISMSQVPSNNQITLQFPKRTS